MIVVLLVVQLARRMPNVCMDFYETGAVLVVMVVQVAFQSRLFLYKMSLCVSLSLS